MENNLFSYAFTANKEGLIHALDIAKYTKDFKGVKAIGNLIRDYTGIYEQLVNKQLVLVHNEYKLIEN